MQGTVHLLGSCILWKIGHLAESNHLGQAGKAGVRLLATIGEMSIITDERTPDLQKETGSTRQNKEDTTGDPIRHISIPVGIATITRKRSSMIQIQV